MDDVLNAFEKKNVELKKAENSVPKSLYETLSAFANTDGGIIYLGVIENSPQNIVVGISNEEQYKKDILNTIHNKSNTNRKNLSLNNEKNKTMNLSHINTSINSINKLSKNSCTQKKRKNAE